MTPFFFYLFPAVPHVCPPPGGAEGLTCRRSSEAARQSGVWLGTFSFLCCDVCFNALITQAFYFLLLRLSLSSLLCYFAFPAVTTRCLLDENSVHPWRKCNDEQHPRASSRMQLLCLAFFFLSKNSRDVIHLKSIKKRRKPKQISFNMKGFFLLSFL